jgi:hypothetical protein
MLRPSLFTHDFLLLMAGPLVWALHFLAIYGFTGVVCARPALPTQLVTWGVAGAGVVAIGMLVAVFVWVKPRAPQADDRQLVRQVGIGLAGLSGLAIVWETLPVFLAAPCT